jgi:acetyl-CoA carboxylase alpha subunit
MVLVDELQRVSSQPIDEIIAARYERLRGYGRFKD